MKEKMDKKRLLDNLYEKLFEAMAQNALNERVIKGEGPFFGTLAFVGEAPGAEEEKKGRPFVGSAGKNLDMFLSTLKVNREDVYITNVVKWRPKRTSSRTGRFINRTPSSREIKLCSPFLFEELKIVEPKITITLGNVALKAVTGDDSLKIGDCHGVLLTVSGLDIFPLYHPASVIYNKALYDIYEQDLRQLKTVIER